MEKAYILLPNGEIQVQKNPSLNTSFQWRRAIPVTMEIPQKKVALMWEPFHYSAKLSTPVTKDVAKLSSYVFCLSDFP